MVKLEVTFIGQYTRTFDFEYDTLQQVMDIIMDPDSMLESLDGTVINFDNVLMFKEI
jgi:hypothetical protein